MINIDFEKWRGLKKKMVSDEKPHFFEASISFAFPPPSSSSSAFGKNTINNNYVSFYLN